MKQSIRLPLFNWAFISITCSSLRSFITKRKSRSSFTTFSFTKRYSFFRISIFFILCFALQNGWIIIKDISGGAMQSAKTAHVILVVLFAVLCVFSLSGDAFLREGRTMDLKPFLKKKAFPRSSRSSISHGRNGYKTDMLRGKCRRNR